MSEGVEIKRGLCWWCRGWCVVNVHVKDGRLLKIEENPEYPRKVFPPVRACERARAAVEWFYHPDRLKFPLKRAAGRGESKWEQISWDQALDEIAKKLREIKEGFGAEAIATTCGTARTNDDYRTRFFYLLGSPNIIGVDQICYGARSIIAESILGWFPCFSVGPETKCIVLLGAEPAVARRPEYKIILDAIGSGAKLVVIDPRLTQSASKATVWLQVRPGSDCALLMGMIKVIIDEKLYDRDFVEKWCYGFDKLVERLKEYELQKVAEITWLPVEKIVEAARLYATNKPACFIEGMGAEHLPNNSAVFHARCILAAITGNLDVKGGEEFAGPHPKFITDREIELSEKLSSQQRRKQIGIDRFRLYSWPGQELVTQNVERVWGKKPNFAGHQCQAHAPSLYRAIITGRPYPIKALITLSSNPMVTAGNTKVVYEALKKVDLYVVMDFWMTPSAELADYVLPAASWLERPSHFDYGSYVPFLLTGERALPPAIPGSTTVGPIMISGVGLGYDLDKRSIGLGRLLRRPMTTASNPWGVR